MKKIIALLAFTWVAVFAANAETEAFWNSGHVRAIVAVPDYQQNFNYPNSDRPLKIGESLYILVRLLNAEYGETKADPTNPAKQYPWDWKYMGIGSATIAQTFQKPALRISLGGALVDAEFSSTGPNGEESGLNMEKPVKIYTDIYFKYTVKPGDLGLPVRLVNVNNLVVDAPDTRSNAGFYLVNSSIWQLASRRDDTKIANLKFGAETPTPNPGDTNYPSLPETAQGNGFGNIFAAFIHPGVYVKTIDFDSTYVDETPAIETNKIWREVYQGLSDYVAKAPAICGEGPKTVYLWSSDESVVELEGSVLEGGRKILSATLNSDGADVIFKIKGSATASAGDTALIYLSPTKVLPTSLSGDVIEGSYLVRKVKIVEAPPPFMTISDANDNQTADLTATNPAKFVQMKLKLSAPFTSNFKVNIKPVPNNVTYDPIVEKYIAVLPTEDGDPANATSVSNLTVEAGQTEVYFYVYGLGRSKEFSQMTITPEIDDGEFHDAHEFYNGTHKKGTIKLNGDMAPQIDASLPASGYKGTSVDVSVTVLTDNWRDTSTFNTNGYNISITLGGTTITTNKVMFAEGEQKAFPVTIPLNWSSSTMTGKVTVTDPTGNKATKDISIDVNETLKAWPATFSSTLKTAQPDEDLYYCEGQNLWVRGVLSEASSVSGLYAYVVPMDAVSSNLVETTALTNGLEITMGDIYSDSAKILLKDGDAEGRKVRLGLVIRNGATWDTSTEDGTYNTAVKFWTLTVTNAAPRVAKVWYGDSDSGSLIANGSTHQGKIPSENEVRFTAQITDRGILDLQDTGKPINVRWVWTDGEGELMPPQTKPVDANGYCTCDIVFYQDNSSQTVSLYAQDRDMKAADKDDFGELLYTFHVKIGEVPSVIISKTAKYDAANGFYESSSKNDNYFLVKLSEFPGKTDHYGLSDGIGTANPLEVKLTLDDSFKSDYGNLLFLTQGSYPVATNEVTVQFTSENQAKNGVKVYLDPDSLTGGEDGPTVFMVDAEVTTVLSNKLGKTWREYYAPGKLYGEELYVWNVDPTIQMLAGDDHSFTAVGTNYWSAGETIKLKWKVSDIKKDITNGMFRVDWTQKNTSNKSGYTLKELGAGVTYTGNNVQKYFAEGTYEFIVPNSVNTDITITANDGDGGVCETHIYIYVEPVQQAKVTAFGPAESTRTLYGNAAGIGQGHIYAEESTGQYLSREFTQTWSYPKSASMAVFRAAGYPASATNAWDNGTMGEVLGYPTAAKLTQNGSKDITVGGLGYQYGASDYDSYVYCWALISSGDGDDEEIKYQTPQFTKSPTTTAQVTPKFGDPKEEVLVIPQVEAIFSRELYPSDNLGDLNADGIPDVFLDIYSGFGVLEEFETANPRKDLQKLNKFNDDEDYLPNTATAYYAAFIPDLADTWVMAGRAFTAEKEIRGNDYHFNDAYQKLSIRSAKADICYADPDTCPTSTLAKVEWMAFVDFCTNRVAGTELDPSNSVNWALWSPENPTDPTDPDTDGDGAPDGYEYYIWYGAHVGWLETNPVTGEPELRKFTGRRYNPADPMNPIFISSKEIEAIYNPSVENEQLTEADTDGDGLADLLEFELGTNPFDYDTDGDGLPDGYEVLVVGKGEDGNYICDPLKFSTNDSIGDGQQNPDGDSMVELPIICKALAVPTELPGVSNYIITAGQAPLYIDDGTGPKFSMKVVDTNGVEYITSEPFSVRSERRAVEGKRVTIYMLAADLNAWTNATVDIESGEVDVSAAVAVVLPAGTELNQKNPTGENAPNYLNMWNYDNGLAGVPGQVVGGRILFPTNFLGKTAEPVLTYQRLLHFDAYLSAPFDPRVGWKHWKIDDDPAMGEVNGDGVVNRPFTTLDEFLMVTYWYRQGYISLRDITPSKATGISQIDIWQKYCTNPVNADTDGDGIPDGWELYTMVDPMALDITAVGPMSDNSPLIPMGTFLEIYDGSECSTCYPDCETITWHATEWTNKHWPCDPWNGDTDGDGIGDLEERGYFIEYGGLNPHSMDTDGDGLPDPWEVEFAGTCHLEGGGSQVERSVMVDPLSGATVTNETVTSSSGTPVWDNNGMNGCVDDAVLDYDEDGLLNWQEYMVGAMRCWRYDDTVSPWESHKLDWTVDEEEMLTDQMSPNYNPHFANGFFDPTAQYFSWCVKEWDSACGNMFMFKDGCTYFDPTDVRKIYKHNMRKGDYQYNLGCDHKWSIRIREGDPLCTYLLHDPESEEAYEPTRYISCDPRKRDTDGDGMDDYYELYHGMNPLLGSIGGYINSAEQPMLDIVYMAYACDSNGMLIKKQALAPDAERNAWIGGHVTAAGGPELISEPKQKNTLGNWDFHAYPWLNGLPEADIDGDGIRNQREAIMPKVQAASTYLHTDPSPLWMTDTSYANSIVRRFYRGRCLPGEENDDMIFAGPVMYATEPFNFSDGSSVLDYAGFYLDPLSGALMWDYHSPWQSSGDATQPNRWVTENYLFDFEEDEGYDTDHDYLSDYEEQQGLTKNPSDAQDSDDPRRRQAMYFDGVRSFLETPLEEPEQLPYDECSSEVRENFLYYTAECWAKPDIESLALDKTVTLLERAIAVSKSSNADQRLIKRNFLIGIRNGRWYTKFDPPTTFSGDAVEITDGPLATNRWTHIAITYGPANDDETDASSKMVLRLYVNGVCNNYKNTGASPEHGVMAITTGSIENEQHLVGELSGHYNYSIIALIVGASARSDKSLVIDGDYRFGPGMGPSWFDYLQYYQGYIDEVRIWDGARSAADILADYRARTRYTRETALANRQAVFEAWAKGARRTAASAAGVTMPPQLMYHFSFDHIPGGINPDIVLQAPAGFTLDDEFTVDHKAMWVRPDGYRNNWWNSIGIKSLVYTDRAWIPWVVNTVAHLPRFDQTTFDSVFWSLNMAGSHYASEFGYSDFKFPCTMEPACNRRQMTHANAPFSNPSRWYLVNQDEMQRTLYRFARRNACNNGLDLLPMGNVYPKRISAAEGGMWDEAGAADAWAQDCNDQDHNSLPDWWEEYALANYLGGVGELTWDATIPYGQLMIPAWQAYLRDLAKGLVWDGSSYRYDDNYADTRDLDGDGMLDWWEDIYGIDTHSKADAKADPDHDGLSNYQEYLISFRDEVYAVDPKLTRSFVGQEVPDYFLQATNENGEVCYLGELYADHDFMEDDTEDEFGFDRTRFDAWSDGDEDGWSAWAEMRYSGYKMNTAARFISHLIGTGEFQDFPTPVIHATLRYHGELVNPDSRIHIEAYSGNNLQKKPNATYTITPGSNEERELFLGKFRDGYVHGTMTPGHVLVGANEASMDFCFMQDNDLWSWSAGGVPQSGTYEQMYNAYLTGGTNIVINADGWSWDHKLINGVEPEISGSDEEGPRDWLQLSVDGNTGKGYFLLNHKRAGTFDAITGDFSLDLSQFKGLHLGGNGVSMEQCFFKLKYRTQLPTMQANKLEVSLARPDEGTLSEGMTAFVAWLDKNGDGVFTPESDPIGFVKGVDVGWDMVPEIEIEMTDASQAAGRRFSVGGMAGETIRIVRTGINGSQLIPGTEEKIQPRIIYSRDLTETSRDYVFEGDLVSGDKFGLDWDNLRADLQGLPGVKLSDVTSVDYRIIAGDIAISQIDYAWTLGSFSVEYTATATKPTAHSPSAKMNPYVETVRPVFSWNGADGYTAFKVQIRDSRQRTVYDSGAQVLPSRDSFGRYVWTAPVWIGTNVCSDAWVLDNHQTYEWRVAQYNAKFSDMSDGASAWSDWAVMKTALADVNDFSTPYGSAKVSLRYFGPATNGLDRVVVQLFRNADYTGTPAAQTRLFAIDGEANSLSNGQEVVLHGLADGEYHAVAFIDRNGDGVRQKYETWGYSARVGLGLRDIWNPQSLTVDANDSKIPSIELFMEDTDVNGDDILDWNQDESLLALASASRSEASVAGDTDGDGLSDLDEAEKSYTKANKWDTDGDGMPDGWEYSFAGTDPATPDSDKVTAAELMAYTEVKYTLITTRSTETGAEESYLIARGEKVPSIGDNVNGREFWATYDYGQVRGLGRRVQVLSYDLYTLATVSNTVSGATADLLFDAEKPIGVGTNVNEETAWIVEGTAEPYELGASTNLMTATLIETNTVIAASTVKVSLGENRVIAIEEDVPVALVHAQVFDYLLANGYGYDQKAAVDAEDPYTRPFTAYDKYLLIRYFEAIGLGGITEEAVNRGAKWADWSLKPGVVDGDWGGNSYGDGIADGWELYVMFGTNGVASATNAVYTTPSKTPINPWRYDDRTAEYDGDGLELIGEYNYGRSTMNPWDAHTLNGDIDDRLAHTYDIASAATQGADNDNDGLSNWQEYLAAVGSPMFAGDLDVRNDYSDGAMLDYFRTNGVAGTGKRYLGEMYADHDFMEDGWEDLFSELVPLMKDTKFTSRWVYDASADHDGDGWDNWSECRGGSDPTQEATLSLVSESADEDNVLGSYPVPVIKVKVTNMEQRPFSGGLVIKAWRGESIDGVPDAVWSAAGSDEATIEHVRFLGLNPNKVVQMNLGPGSISRDSLKLGIFDPNYQTETRTFDTNGTPTGVAKSLPHTADTSKWAPYVYTDKPKGADSDDGRILNNGTIDYKTGDITIDFSEIQNEDAVVITENSPEQKVYEHYNEQRAYIRLQWKSRLVSKANEKTLYISKSDDPTAENPCRGHVRQGLNTFLVFEDENGDGNWSEGEPFGFVKGVDVQWDKAEFAVELTRSTAAFPRFAVGDEYGEDTRVRIIRRAINGDENIKHRIVFTKKMDFTSRKWMTEADYANDSRIAIDSAYLVRDAIAAGIAPADIRTVAYDVVLGEGNIDATNVNVVAVFTNSLNATRTAPVPTELCEGANTRLMAARPTFCFNAASDYTAYDLQVSTNGTESGIVWQSGVKLLPVKGASGYEVVAPVYVGLEIPDGADCYWRASLYNAKYTTTNQLSKSDIVWCDWAKFTVAVDSTDNNTGYGKVAAEVRYYGPATNTFAQVTVGLWNNAGFAGDPIAKKILGGDGSTVDALGRQVEAGRFLEVVTNVVFDGVAPGVYYAMAYIDSNGNGKRDAWETWGYANNVGTGSQAIWSPVAVKVVAEHGNEPKALVVMEDTDIDNDGLPDCVDPNYPLVGGEATSIDGDPDLDGLFSTEESEDYYTDPYVWDTDEDGMPDGWEAVFAKTEPLTPDGDSAEDGDVMAFALVQRKMVSVWDGVNEDVIMTYILADDDSIPNNGDRITSLQAYETYAYGDRIGIGKAVTLTGGQVLSVDDTTVALVHAQVYDEFGYDPTTATSITNAVNTKPFTALDKYLVVRYLEALGYADEAAMNTNRAWAAYTLKPGTPDSDHDGIADGWELYTMFGDQPRPATLAEAKISPWNYDDARAASPSGELTVIAEYDSGFYPTDPWNKYSHYEWLMANGWIDSTVAKFEDGTRRKFDYLAITNGDPDNDMIGSADEILAYYLDPAALDDINIENAWSDGSTPDYFRACGSEYLGGLFNGGEWIEPATRQAMSIAALEMCGTRDYQLTGWDAWSTAHYSMNQKDAIDVRGVSAELALVIRYLDATLPGEFAPTNTSIAAVRDFIHEHWKGVCRIFLADGTYSDSTSMAAVSYNGEVFTVEADTIVTTADMIKFFGGKQKMQETIIASKVDITAEEITTPEVKPMLVLKYAGNQTKQVVVEAYQRSSAYPEYGEQLAARWSVTAPFNLGVAQLTLDAPALGSLNQGKTKFVAYIDLDGSGDFSAGDTYGITETYVGYLGADVTIRLNEMNPFFTDLIREINLSTNTTTVLVRELVNGVPQYNDRGVFYISRNNPLVSILYPEEFVTEDFIGFDRKLASDLSKYIDDVESVTYEVLDIPVTGLDDINVTNLNYYAYYDIPGHIAFTNQVPRINREFTINYSLERDRVDALAIAGETEDDLLISFRLPEGACYSRFWLDINGSVYDGADHHGMLLPGGAEGVVVLDSEWLEKNGITLHAGAIAVKVLLGNDKFDYTIDEDEWSKTAEFNVNAAPVRPGKINVVVKHPVAADSEFTGRLTLAVYEKADLANPYRTYTGLNAGAEIELDGLRAGVDYYIAVWSVKNADDGRASAADREPYDTWGYLANLNLTNATGLVIGEALDPITVTAEKNVSRSYTIWMQDTDWNDNGKIDRTEDFKAIDGVSNARVGIFYDTKEFNESESGESEDVNPLQPVRVTAMAKDVYAYAEVEYYCVSVTNWIKDAQNRDVMETRWFAVLGDQAGKVYAGTPLSEIKGLASTYQYDSSVNSLALGSNVTFTAANSWKTTGSAYKRLILAHAQVFDYFGFNENTANGFVSTWVNTREFPTSQTKKDLIVTNYLANVLGIVDPNDHTLPANVIDSDGSTGGQGDGIADGWELYTMFRPDDVSDGLICHVDTLDDARVHISPWRYDDRAGDPDTDGLANVNEFDNGYHPTNPYDIDSDGDSVVDQYAWKYNLKGGNADKDDDGDGLSNYTEYLISEVFDFMDIDSGDPMTSDECVDYFKKVGDYYLGEIFTDHDQVDDQWEEKYAEANRYIYDPSRDDDLDGWSNYAEAKVGTDPGAVDSLGVGGYTVPEHPVPVIKAKVIYNGTTPITAPLVFKAWSKRTDSDMTSAPSAIWTVPTLESGDVSDSKHNPVKYLGVNPGMRMVYWLGPGSVSAGSVRIHFRDQGYERAVVKNGVEISTASGDSANPDWYVLVQDVNGRMVTVVTNQTSIIDVGSIDYKTGRLELDFSNPALLCNVYAKMVSASYDNDDSGKQHMSATEYFNCEKLHLKTSHVRIGWTRQRIGTSVNGTFYLSDADSVSDDTKEASGADTAKGPLSWGYVREGMNKFVVFADTVDANGEYDAGEPFGFVDDVDIGWSGAAFEVELTETHPVFARIDLKNPEASDRTFFYGTESGNWTNTIKGKLSGGQLERVRVVRTLINGLPTGKPQPSETNAMERLDIYNRVVLDKWMDLSVRSFLHEGDFLSDDRFDIDWFDFEDEVVYTNTVNTTKNKIDPCDVVYRVVLGNGTVDPLTTNNILSVGFTRRFDAFGKLDDHDNFISLRKVPQNLSVRVSNGSSESQINYAAHPRFRWTMEGYNSYTCFRLQIRKRGTTTNIYETDYVRMPNVRRDDNRDYYEWEMTDCIGNQTPLGKVLEYIDDYEWRVSMYNAKFRTDYNDRDQARVWSSWSPFSSAVGAASEMDSAGYSSIAVSVKYAGPEKVLERCDDLTQVNGIVRVQAFDSPDFTGVPAAETFVTNRADITNTSVITANAVLKGLPKDGTYYIRAYIDSNGNFKKDAFESWGAAKEAVVLNGAITRPIVGLYIEDADTDGDWVPDALEYATAGWSGEWETIKNNISASVEPGGKVFFSTEAFNQATNRLANFASTSYGASMTIFENGSFITAILGSSGYTGNMTIADIRAAVEKAVKVKENTVEISAFTLDYTSGIVHIYIEAEVAPTIAGEMLGKIYNITPGSSKNVNVKVYKKDTLAQVDWTLIKTVPTTIGNDKTEVTVSTGITGEELQSGFYKIEIEE